MAGLGPFVLDRVRARPAHDVHAQPALLAEGRGRATRCRISIASSSSSSPTQDAEVLRLAGRHDRPDDAGRRAARRLSRRCAACATRARCSSPTSDIGVDPNMLWFNLTPGAGRGEAEAYLPAPEFRQAISYAVDRDAIVNTRLPRRGRPGLRPGHAGQPDVVLRPSPRSIRTIRRAPSALLARLGPDRSQRRRHARRRRGHAGAVFDPHAGAAHLASAPPRSIQEQLRQARHRRRRRRPRSAVDLRRDSARETTRASTSAFRRARSIRRSTWTSGSAGGSNHFWHPNQSSPSTPWEKTVDELMRRQTAAGSLEERQRLFAQVQTVFGEQLPAIYFVAPKISVALNRRVGGAQPGAARSQGAVELGHALRLGRRRTLVAKRASRKDRNIRRAPASASSHLHATAHGAGAGLRGRVRSAPARADGAGRLRRTVRQPAGGDCRGAPPAGAGPPVRRAVRGVGEAKPDPGSGRIVSISPAGDRPGAGARRQHGAAGDCGADPGDRPWRGRAAC